MLANIAVYGLLPLAFAGSALLLWRLLRVNTRTTWGDKASAMLTPWQQQMQAEEFKKALIDPAHRGDWWRYYGGFALLLTCPPATAALWIIDLLT